MEDILASIRRILSEDETHPPVAEEHTHPEEPGGKDVFILDPSMMVEEPQQKAAAEHSMSADASEQTGSVGTPIRSASNLIGDGIVAPEAAAAAQSSVGSMIRTLTERATQVNPGGPTIEDLVREEIRPVLKQWLDTHLPPIVERFVRLEIERVIGRAVP